MPDDPKTPISFRSRFAPEIEIKITADFRPVFDFMKYQRAVIKQIIERMAASPCVILRHQKPSPMVANISSARRSGKTTQAERWCREFTHAHPEATIVRTRPDGVRVVEKPVHGTHEIILPKRLK